MEEENFETFFKYGQLNHWNNDVKRMVYVSHLEAARDYIDIAKEHTSKLIKIASRSQKGITQMKAPQKQHFS